MKLIIKNKNNIYLSKKMFNNIEKYFKQEKILYNCLIIHNYCILTFKNNYFLQNKFKKLTYNNEIKFINDLEIIFSNIKIK
jgi:hypothetical protein